MSSMNWRCLIDTLPLPNAIIMIGEIDESHRNMNLLMTRALLFMKIAEMNLGQFIQAKPQCFNYPPAKKGKIVLQFQMMFPSKQRMETFIKELSLLN